MSRPEEELISAVKQANAAEVDRILASGRVHLSEIGTIYMPGPGTSTTWTTCWLTACTLLHYVVRTNQVDILRKLIAAWPEGLRTADVESRTPLAYAAEEGYVEGLQLMLEKWPDAIEAGLSKRDRWGSTPLHDAAKHGHLQALQLMLSLWPDGITATDGFGRTLLMHATQKNHLLAARWLAQQWMPPTAVLGCNHVVDYGCNGTAISTAWQDAAVNLQCDARSISSSTAQLWKECGGHPHPLANLDYINCSIIVDWGCNDTEMLSVWQDAALELRCDPRPLSRSSLQLWLDCGGDIRWQSPAGLGLMELLQDKDVSQLLRSHRTRSSIIEATLRDWRTWLVPGSVILLAVVVVLLEQKLLQSGHHWASQWSSQQAQSEDPAENLADPFLEGSKRLVGQAFSKQVVLLKLWRWLESYVAMLWSGFMLIVAYWIWWLPLVALLYFVPAARLHTPHALLRTPVLAIPSKGFDGRLAALNRTMILLILGFAVCILADSSFPDGWLKAAVVNPIFPVFVSPRFASWDSSLLSDHWLLWWAGQIQGTFLFLLGMAFSCGLLGLYVMCLLCSMLAWKMCGSAGSLDSSQAQKQEAVKALLQKAPEHFAQVNPSIKPIAAFAWPWQGGGLYQTVALLVVDVALDANTIFAFLAAQDYLSAAVMTFVVARSGLKQLIALPPWRLLEAALVGQLIRSCDLSSCMTVAQGSFIGRVFTCV